MRVLSLSKGRTSVGASCEAQGSWLVLVDFNGVRRVVPCWEQLRLRRSLSSNEEKLPELMKLV